MRDIHPHPRGAIRVRALHQPSPSKSRGRRESRVAAAPGASAQRDCAKARRPQVQAGSNRPSLRSGLRLIRDLPGEPALATVARVKPFELRTNLTRAWARQDHTTSPSAGCAARQQAHPRPPHSAPRVVTIAIRPFARCGMAEVMRQIRNSENRNIFARGA